MTRRGFRRTRDGSFIDPGQFWLWNQANMSAPAPSNGVCWPEVLVPRLTREYPAPDHAVSSTVRTCCPYFASFASPTPLTLLNSASDVGHVAAISRRVASWNITYAGTP